MNEPPSAPQTEQRLQSQPSRQRLKVLYIAGNGRSGSTLLDNILGQLPGFFSVGEVRQIWDEGIIDNRLCGCGEPVRQCSVWGDVLKHLSTQATIDGQHVAQLRERLAQTKRLIPILASPQRYRRRTVAGLDEFLAATGALYEAIAKVTQCRVIVDSSKWPTYSFLLDLLPELDVHVLHLVRDPRACAFSWSRGKEVEPGRPMGTQSAFHSTAYWVVWNPAIRRIWRHRSGRYRFLRYEDFMRQPQTTIRDILKFASESADDLPFTDATTITKARTHAISGNPSKFKKGSIQLALDDEWRRKMPIIRRSVVTSMTWPLLWKYGYLSGKRPGNLD